jgi:hypothetical protein
MLSLCHGKLPKVVPALFTTLTCGRRGDEISFVSVHQLCNIDWNSSLTKTSCSSFYFKLFQKNTEQVNFKKITPTPKKKAVHVLAKQMNLIQQSQSA